MFFKLVSTKVILKLMHPKMILNCCHSKGECCMHYVNSSFFRRFRGHFWFSRSLNWGLDKGSYNMFGLVNIVFVCKVCVWNKTLNKCEKKKILTSELWLKVIWVPSIWAVERWDPLTAYIDVCSMQKWVDLTAQALILMVPKSIVCWCNV